MDIEKLKLALQQVQDALDTAMAECSGDAEEEATESDDSPEEEDTENQDMRKKAIAASISKALGK